MWKKKQQKQCYLAWHSQANSCTRQKSCKGLDCSKRKEKGSRQCLFFFFLFFFFDLPIPDISTCPIAWQCTGISTVLLSSFLLLLLLPLSHPSSFSFDNLAIIPPSSSSSSSSSRTRTWHRCVALYAKNNLVINLLDKKEKNLQQFPNLSCAITKFVLGEEEALIR